MTYIDETGNTYGRLTVLRKATEDERKPIKNRSIQWVCQCSCGNITIVPGTRLRNGDVKSCGCLQKDNAGKNLEKNIIDETGKRYGRLTVLYKVGKSKNRTAIWHCRCDCGNEVDVLGTHLRDGHTKSCGCLQVEILRDISLGKMSSIEKVVYKILKKNNIDFIQEKVFTDLRNGKYRFDFYIPYLPSGEIVLEVNGMQHYKYSKFFHKNRSEFTKAKERDRQKIGYCLAHNIRLYIIPCWDIDTIKKLDDLFRDKYLALTKYHNDEAWRLKILEDNV